MFTLICIDSSFLQASSSCDGTVRIWSLQQSGKQVQSWNWAPKSNDFSNSPSLCRIQFEPTTGQFLAVPSFPTSSVKIIERNTWKEVAELQHERLKDVNKLTFFILNPFLKFLFLISRFLFVAGRLAANIWPLHPVPVTC